MVGVSFAMLGVHPIESSARTLDNVVPSAPDVLQATASPPKDTDPLLNLPLLGMEKRILQRPILSAAIVLAHSMRTMGCQ